MMRGSAEMTFGVAKQFCSDHQMELPKPKNQEENGLFTQFGPTWLDIYVNDLLSKFFWLYVNTVHDPKVEQCNIFGPILDSHILDHLVFALFYSLPNY